MNAMQKVAWMELAISLGAVAAAVLLAPWLGERATAAFAILGALPLGALFLRPRGNEVVVDERDRQIEKRAMFWGISAAWMTLFMVVIAAGMWQNFEGKHAVATQFLNWLVWTQFAICYGVKGLVSVLTYWRQQHAA